MGGGSFASYGFSSTASLGEVDVHLHRKLPEDVWLRVGGYKDWSLTIGGRERHGLSEDEVIDLVRAAIEAGGGDLWLTRYQEDSLSLLVEPRRAFVMYTAFPGDSGMTARDEEMKGSHETAAFTLSNGQVDEFPYEETLSKNDALAVVGHFLNAGELAPSVRWVES